MQNETNEPQDVETTEVEETEEETSTPEPTDDINELKARLQRLEEKSITQRERTRLLKQELEKARKAAAPKEPEAKKTGELDETALDYLDLKGISDDDEIAIVQKVMERTGQTVRQALKDEYVQSKLEAIRKEKEVKNATPSGTKRSSASQQNDLALAVSKFKQSGQLPDDFKLRTEVVNFIAEESNGNKPRWH